MRKIIFFVGAAVMHICTSPLSAQESFQEYLKSNKVRVQTKLSQYDHDLFNEVVREQTFPMASEPGTTQVEFAGNTWQVDYKYSQVNGMEGVFDLSVAFILTEGASPQTAPSVELVFDDWSADNYVLLPAAAYNGNRFEARHIRYSPKLLHPDDIGPEQPMIISDVPRLNIDAGPSRIQERSGSMTVPAMGFQDSTNARGFWLMTYQQNAFGDYGMSIEENRERDRAIFSVTSPVMRERYMYKITDRDKPSVDLAPDLKKGDTVHIPVRLYFFKAPGVQLLYDKLFEIRTDLHPDDDIDYSIPLSACFEVQEQKFNDQNYVDQHGYYAVGMRDGKYPFLQDWQIGWTGGMISTYPLLFHGDDATRQNVVNNFNWLFPDGICPAGFFWDAGESKGDQMYWYGGDIRKPHTADWHLIRKSGDGLYYIYKQLMLMKQLDVAIAPGWEQGTKGVTDAVVDLWKKWGQLGQFIDSQSGDISVGGSTSGAIVPAALVLAADYFDEPQYLAAAESIGDHYYTNYVQKGITCGGPGDAMQNPDSESSYAMVESFMKLYEATEDDKWLSRGAEMAKQFATWVMAYNYQFPDTSDLGEVGVDARGCVFANTQNKHGAPGICTHSGIALLRLFRATGDERYAQLLQDVTRHIPQNLSHPDNPISGMNYGWMSERVNTTDWLEGIGELMFGSTWSETALMLTYTELPGLYVQPDKSFFMAFDQVQVEKQGDSQKYLKLKVRNPTEATARVKLLVEQEADLEKPLGENQLLNAEVITLEPGASTTLRFKQ